MDGGILDRMWSRPRLVTSVLLLAGAGLTNAGCGSSGNKSPTGLTSLNHSSGGSNGAAASGGSSATGTGATGTGATDTGGSSGIVLTGGTTGTSGSSGSSDMGNGATGPQCGGDDYAAMLVPLDLYVMLDRSSSMLDQVNNVSKWDAITKALTTFISDPASSGIGIGLQFFPYQDPNVPETCNSSADCGANNPCVKDFCQNLGPKIYLCDTTKDCLDARGQNGGPCTPLTYCWSTGDLCHGDADCNNVVGDCVPFNECSGDPTYSCKQAGSTCRSGTQNLGACRAITTFSCQHTSDCRLTTYSTPAAEIATLPGAAAALEKVLMSTMPQGDTPTSPALGGAIAHAQAWAKAHPDHKVAVLLATDGLPSDCVVNQTDADPYGLTEITMTTAMGVNGNPSIKTFVVGVFAPMDTDSPSNLNQIAKAGGTNMAYVVNTGSDVESQFLSTLDMIRGASLPCQFQIPTPTTGNFDPKLVNVVFTTGGQEQTLDYWPDASSCDATSGGWYYAYDNAMQPSQIIACPASCNAFQSASDGHVAIRLGCMTKTVVK
jgi:hypothetical protein